MNLPAIAFVLLAAFVGLVLLGHRQPPSWRHDLLVSLGFLLANVAAHLLWAGVSTYWEFVASAILLTGTLSVWLAREWHRLQLTMTRIYCVAAAFDLLAEGLLQPWHQCTGANILCTGRLYLVFFIYWIIVAGWNLRRRSST